MINLFSRFKKIISSSRRSAPAPTPKPSATRVKKAVSKNRVVFSGRSPRKQPRSPARSPAQPRPAPVKQVSRRPAQPRPAPVSQATLNKEKEIFQRRSALNEKEKYLIQKEKTLDQQKLLIQTKLANLDKIYKKQLAKLETISNLSLTQAKKLIISSTEKKLKSWIAQKITETKESLHQKEEELAKEILIDSIRHGTTDWVAEYTVSTITLPDDKVKGKIIGREGRNIRAFEKATGVELELDETNDVRISSFDSTRREIAKIALQKLIKDGRIQPVKIETVVAQTQNEMDRILLNQGKKICQEVGVYSLPVSLIKQIGKYKFRFSYGQNLAKHTIEVTKIAVAIAHELRADVKIVRLGGLLHDIGKVVSDQEGTHVDLGVNLLRQYKIPQTVLDCVAQHHEDQAFSSVESAIVHVGDAASGTRPGARYEVHEEYLKRMKNIEEVAKSFPGVTSVAAYQAGREVIVIVDPGKISDDEAVVLSQNISEKLEEEAKWAGQIKVTVIRELRTSSVVTASRIKNNAVKKSS